MSKQGHKNPPASGAARTHSSDSSLVGNSAEHRSLLKPLAEVPAPEKWLYSNREAMASVQRGLGEAAQSALEDRGSFAEFVS